MALYTFKLPDIGEGIAESEVALWRVTVGEVVVEDQPLADMLTDKAAVEIPSPVAGKVISLHGAVGDKIPVGGKLVTLETGPFEDRSSIAIQPPGVAQHPPASSPVVPTDDAPAVGLTESKHALPVAAAPTVRKHARELGIDLQAVKGSGPSGRILHTDLNDYVDRSGDSSQSVAQLPVAKGESEKPIARLALTVKAQEEDDDQVETIKVVGLRRKIAEAMQRSKQRIPHFAYVEEVDVSELEGLRVHLNSTYPDRPKLTLLPLLIQAVVKAIPAFPMVNATYDDEAGVVSRYRALHVGIATQTPGGLVVPVLRHAERQDLWERASNVRRLADAARAGKGKREELSGSTFTITSLGAIGGLAATPVINAPEVAIMGVNKMVERPIVRNGQIVVRTMMNLSSSFDHRIVDGYDAASFIQEVKLYLEHPATLFLEPY